MRLGKARVSRRLGKRTRVRSTLTSPASNPFSPPVSSSLDSRQPEAWKRARLRAEREFAQCLPGLSQGAGERTRQVVGESPRLCSLFSVGSAPAPPPAVPWPWPARALKEQTEGNLSVIESCHVGKARQTRVSPLSLRPCTTGPDAGAVVGSPQRTVPMTAPPFGQRTKERGPWRTESISRTQRGAQACDPYRFMIARTSPSLACMGPKQNSKPMKSAAHGHCPIPQGLLDACAGRI